MFKNTNDQDCDSKEGGESQSQSFLPQILGIELNTYVDRQSLVSVVSLLNDNLQFLAQLTSIIIIVHLPVEL